MAAPKVCGLKLYLDSLCIGEHELAKKDPVAACKYMADTGTSFRYFGGTSIGLGQLGLPIPVGQILPICPFSNVPFYSGKRVSNGGECACQKW